MAKRVPYKSAVDYLAEAQAKQSGQIQLVELLKDRYKIEFRKLKAMVPPVQIISFSPVCSKGGSTQAVKSFAVELGMPDGAILPGCTIAAKQKSVRLYVNQGNDWLPRLAQEGTALCQKLHELDELYITKLAFDQLTLQAHSSLGLLAHLRATHKTGMQIEFRDLNLRIRIKSALGLLTTDQAPT